MGTLPEFIAEIDEHSRQMYLAHRAMHEDIRTACLSFYGDHFKTPERRSKDFLLEGLAWAASAGSSEAFQILEDAEHYLWFHRDNDIPQHSRMDQHGQMYTAYRTIHSIYRAMRSHGMIDSSKRSEHWAQVQSQYLELYDRND